jgi:hypothetical protein
MKKILLLLFVFTLTLSSDLLSNDYSKIEFTNTKGVVFQSFDNGQTWVRNYSKIEFTNTKGIVFQSFDNGQSWERVNNNNNKAIVEILTIEFVNCQGTVYHSNDGGVTWTKVKKDSEKLSNDNTNILVYPNPSTSILKVNVNLPSQELYSIVLTDILGNLVFDKQEQLKKGDNTFEIDVSNLVKGYYMISINGSSKCSANFVKE